MKLKLSVVTDGFRAFSTYALLFGLPSTFGLRISYFIGWMLGGMIASALFSLGKQLIRDWRNR